MAVAAVVIFAVGGAVRAARDLVVPLLPLARLQVEIDEHGRFIWGHSKATRLTMLTKIVRGARPRAALGR